MQAGYREPYTCPMVDQVCNFNVTYVMMADKVGLYISQIRCLSKQVFSYPYCHNSRQKNIGRQGTIYQHDLRQGTFTYISLQSGIFLPVPTFLPTCVYYTEPGARKPYQHDSRSGIFPYLSVRIQAVSTIPARSPIAIPGYPNSSPWGPLNVALPPSPS